MSFAGDIAEKNSCYLAMCTKTPNKMLKSGYIAPYSHPAVKYGTVLHRFSNKQ
jgi:hypothetical protein